MFSFLKQQPHNKKRVYLDNAGATEVSKRAKDELIRALALYGNPSAIHHEGDQVSRLLDAARNRAASVLNAHAYEIYFVGSGTDSCNVAVLGTYKGSQQSTANSQQTLPHIITSTIEHPAVLEPIRYLEKEKKIRVTYVPVYEDGIVKVADVREALCEETILVSVMYANNEIGTLQPIKEIGRAIEAWKRENDRSFTSYPYLHTDACQAANYCNLDVVRLHAHLMTVNSSKCYGPKGVALLYKREGIRVDPISYGGGQERGMRSGTESVALASAFAEALKESQEIKDKESMRLRTLRDYLKNELQKHIPDITFYGAFDEINSNAKRYTLHAEVRLPNNLNIRVPGIPSDEMIIRLDQKGFAISHKSACASAETDGSYVIEALGATKQEALENVRITLGRSTTKQDLIRLVQAMKEIKERFAR
jgi:cysteine desulfurase